MAAQCSIWTRPSLGGVSSLMSPSPTTPFPPSLPSDTRTGRPTRRQCLVGVRGLEHEGSIAADCGHDTSTSFDSRQSSLPERQ